MIRAIIITVLTTLISVDCVLGQLTPQNACRIDDNKLIFTFNLEWSEKQKKEFLNLFDIDSVIIESVIKGNNNFNIDGVIWSAKRISPNTFEFSKSLNDGISENEKYDHLLLTPFINELTEHPSSLNANYGINKIEDPECFKYSNGVATFFLPKNTYAKKVYISGTFNGWSTMQTPMQKTDIGWVVNLKLNPGKYHYKYIIDGKWTHDTNNALKEKNEHGSYNSVVFCYNYRFKLNSYPKAKKVILTGSFNGWNKNELQMNRTSTGWDLEIYLREGTHAYKFIVDNTWILDPDNPVKRPDGRGNTNSFVGIGNIHTFKLKGYLNAEKVFVAGNFNAWNGGELLMEKTTDGWILPYHIASGIYEYKFVVDGKWIVDPSNTKTIGSGKFENSVVCVNPNVTLTVNSFKEAEKVILSGSFNGWSKEGYQMEKTDSGWTISIYLKPGKYTYKLIVDGEWKLDPNNNLWEQNQFGSGNSVLWIKP